MGKTNVVVILIDDMGWVDLSCQGSTFYETPNIDRLAKNGLRFTNAYAACPVCSPTRASLQTGKYPARLGLTHYIGLEGHWLEGAERGRLLSAPYIPYLDTNEFSIAKAFKKNGYQAWHVGKWHLGTEEYWPLQQGYDINRGGCNRGAPAGKGKYFVPWDIPTLEDKPDDDYLTDRIGDEAADLINNADGKPFYLNLCFYAVHTPIMAKEEKIAKYKAKAKTLGIDQKFPFTIGEKFSRQTNGKHRVIRRTLQSDPTYAAMVEHLDENVGKVIDALEKNNLLDDTLVIFTSDNGGLATSEGSPTCNAPLSEGKGWMYEGGVRVPFLVHWPAGLKTGGDCQSVVGTPDIYPTVLAACGLPPEPEQHVDGRNFLPALKGETYEREAFYWHYPHYGNQGNEPACAIREGDWKLIDFFDGDRRELYNLKNDPGENFDQRLNEPELAARLTKKLHAWLDEIEAKIPQPNPDYPDGVVPWLRPELNPWQNPLLDPLE